MKLTPLAKAFVAFVVFFVIGFATWHYKGDAIKQWAGGSKTAEGGDSKGDFDKLKGGPGDPGRGVGATAAALTPVEPTPRPGSPGPPFSLSKSPFESPPSAVLLPPA